MYGNREEDFLRFNIFSLYCHIGPALGPEPLNQGSSNLQLRLTASWTHYHAYNFSQIYIFTSTNEFANRLLENVKPHYLCITISSDVYFPFHRV